MLRRLGRTSYSSEGHLRSRMEKTKCLKQEVIFFKLFKRYLPHTDVFVASIKDPFDPAKVILVTECSRCQERGVKTLEASMVPELMRKFPLLFLSNLGKVDA